MLTGLFYRLPNELRRFLPVPDRTVSFQSSGTKRFPSQQRTSRSIPLPDRIPFPSFVSGRQQLEGERQHFKVNNTGAGPDIGAPQDKIIRGGNKNSHR